MKRLMMVVWCIFGFLCLWVLTGCEGDWTSGGDSGFNTSKGAGVNINFSGVYHGQLSGSKAVASSSGSPITRFVIMHAANTVQVTDNNGSQYDGTIGSPGAVAQPSGGTYPAGADMVQSQVSFKGKDNTSGKVVEFVGIFRAVAVEDIQGTVTKDERSRTENYVWKTNVTISTMTTNKVQTITVIGYDPVTGQEVYRSVETITISPQGTVISRDVEVQDNRSQTTTQEVTYRITENNTQYILEGTWMEEGGRVSEVKAMSKGAASTITTTTTSPTGAGAGT